MATGSLALLAVLAGIAGFALYKHLKSQKKAHSSARTIGNRQRAFTAKYPAHRTPRLRGLSCFHHKIVTLWPYDDSRLSALA